MPDASDAFQPDVPVRGGHEWSRAPRLGLAEQPQWSDQLGEPERRHHILPVSCLQVEVDVVRRSNVAGAEDSVIADAVKARGRTWNRKRGWRGPLAERYADFEQVVARRGELVVMRAPVGCEVQILDFTAVRPPWCDGSRWRDEPDDEPVGGSHETS